MSTSAESGVWVRAWSKGNAQRLYVNGRDASGADIDYGFVDLVDGTVIARRVEMPAAEVYRLASTWAVAHQHPCPPPRELKDATPTQTSDVATQRAGVGLTPHARGFSARNRSWRIGRRGEQKVGKVLDRLPRARVLHNVQIGSQGGDIDHVVFDESAGVVVVSTKHHPGAQVTVDRARGVRVNSQRTEHITQLAMHTDVTARRLSRIAGTTIPVTGILAIVGADQVQVLSAASFAVLQPGQLADWFTMRETSLTVEQVRWLFEQARDPGVWLR